MSRGTMGRVLVWILAILVVLTSGLIFAGAPPRVPTVSDLPLSTSGSMLIWEAYSRGFISIIQVNVPFGGSEAALGYEVSSTSSDPVAVAEYVMLLSPNSLDFDLLSTTQDGILSDGTIGASDSLLYHYGDLVASGELSPPPWWCTEERQFVRADTPVSLGGEIAPFGMEPILGDIEPGPDGTQDRVWAYLRENASPVVGKTVNGAFWGEIPELEGQSLSVILRATNLAITDEAFGLPEPDAPTARVWDIIPKDYVLDEGTVSPGGYHLQPNWDGSTTIYWVADLPAADVTGKPADTEPTPYVSRTFSYTMTTPRLPATRVGLPRASVSVADDSTAEAHSEQPLLDVFAVPEPPLADAGPVYRDLEAGTITFSAAGSSDPDGDSLKYRWDFGADGIWDTDLSTDPTATHTFGDDLSGMVRVEVSDGVFTTTAESSLTVDNVAPSVSVLVAPCSEGDDEDDDDEDDEGDDDDDDDEDDEGDDHDDDVDCGDLASETMLLDTHDPANVGRIVTTSFALTAGRTYRVTVEGTYSIFDPDAWTSFPLCDPSRPPEPNVQFPSPSGAMDGPAGQDAQFFFSSIILGGSCVGGFPQPAFHPGTFQVCIDGTCNATSWFHPSFGLGAYNPSHIYHYDVVGEGFTLSARRPDVPYSDNYGQLNVTVEELCPSDDDDDEDDDEDDEGDDDEDEGDDEDGGDGAGEEGCGGGGDEEGARRAFILTATATDPGSDDLTFTWSGNCTGFAGPVTYPNDPAVIPDPDPSPDVNDRNVTDTQRVVCGTGAGDDDDDDDDEDDEGGGPISFSYELRVEDDDGGVTILSGIITIDEGGDDDGDDDDDDDEDGDD